MIAASAALVREQSFLLALPFSLLDRKLRLGLGAPRVAPTVLSRDGEPARFDVLRVERPGTDAVIDLVVARDTRRPVLLERRTERGLVGVRLERWQSARGIRLATQRTDVHSATVRRVPLVLPANPHYRERVAIEAALVPERGQVVLVSAIEIVSGVDESLFSPRR